MDKSIIINAVETHFEGQLNGIEKNGVDIDGEGLLIVKMQHHSFVFNEGLRFRVQRFIDQYISQPNGANWLRDEEYNYKFAGFDVTFKTEMIHDEEHDVLVFFDGIQRASVRNCDFIDYRAALAKVEGMTL